MRMLIQILLQPIVSSPLLAEAVKFRRRHQSQIIRHFLSVIINAIYQLTILKVAEVKGCGCVKKWGFFRSFMIWLRCPILNITALSDRSAMNESSGSKDFCGDRPVSKEAPFLHYICKTFNSTKKYRYGKKILVIDKKCDRP